MDSKREVGRFSNPLYGAKMLNGKSEKEVNDMKLKELKNGRLAMIGKLDWLRTEKNIYFPKKLRTFIIPSTTFDSFDS